MMDPNNPYAGFKASTGQTDFSALKAPKSQKDDSTAKLLAEVSSGLRILEDRYYNLRKKAQLIEQSLLDAQRSFAREKRVLAEELIDTRMKVQELLEEIELMKSEIKDAVKQSDLKVLEKYLDMWEPIQFVTRKEVDEILEEWKGQRMLD